MTATREDVVREARSWLETPYHHMADVKGSGVDCAMILVRIYCDLGLVPLFDPRPYSGQWHLNREEERYLAGFKQHAHPVDTPQPGDIALYKFGRCVSHSGIIVDADNIVHAHLGDGEVVLTEMRTYADRFAGYWSVFP